MCGCTDAKTYTCTRITKTSLTTRSPPNASFVGACSSKISIRHFTMFVAKPTFSPMLCRVFQRRRSRRLRRQPHPMTPSRRTLWIVTYIIPTSRLARSLTCACGIFSSRINGCSSFISSFRSIIRTVPSAVSISSASNRHRRGFGL